MPVVGLLAVSIWVSKNLIIHILFTPDFLPMRPLFTFQLLGDFFKVGSWLLAYLMLAKAMVKIFVVTEILFAGMNVLLSYYFMDRFGIIGATYAFCLNYSIYWLVMWLLMKKHIL